jgi:all-trans-retinol 13,14-reductase
LVKKMVSEARNNGVDLRREALVEKILVEKKGGIPTVSGIRVNGRDISCRVVLSNANLKNTVLKLIDPSHLDPEFLQEAKNVRVNSSSCQVYIGIRKGETIPNIGDLVFSSDAKEFSSDELTDIRTQSRTFSVYYPDTRPHVKEPRYAIVASLNAKWDDWANLSDEDYQKEKDRLCEESLESLEKFIPDIRQKVDHIEAATPRTINYYTRHTGGTSFGTKFEGLKVSQELPEKIHGMYHAGSVGIIMSGWLGTINYGVIVSNKVDKYLRTVLPGADQTN